MKKNEIFLIMALFLVAFALRYYDLSYPDFKWMDEAYHVPAATNYWTHGQFEPDNWEHPPLRHSLLYLFLQLFGDNPYGWRMRNVLFGSGAAVLTYFFARKASGSNKAALMAGLLLATDPLHVVMSRYTYEEIYGGAFFLTAVVLWMVHRGRTWLYMLSALFMGLALATKWYYVPCWLLILLLTLKEKDNFRKPGTVFFIASSYLLIPLSVFVLSYYQWFGRGYSISDLVDFILNAYHALQLYQRENYDFGLFFLKHTSAAEWFLGPVIVGQGTYLDAEHGEFILFMNSLPIWILTLPALIGTAVLSLREKNWGLAAPALLFCASYLLYFLVRRPSFIYSAVPLLPLALTTIACAAQRLGARFGSRAYYAALALMVAWNLFLYPLVTAKKVPVAPYRYVLDHADLNLH